MPRRTDLPVVSLGLTAAALVLAAPVAGRMGFSFVADVLVSLAAASGTAGFLAAAAASLLHLRQQAARPVKRP